MISVIVPAKNASKTLGGCLQALLHQECMQLDNDYEVIVVDDGSTDDTAEIAEQHAVRVIRQNNGGPAAARNAGARIARGTLLAFTDADCTPSPAWLKDIVQPLHDPEVVGVKGVYRTRQTELAARFVQLEYEYKYTRMRKQPAIDFIDTYCAAYRKEVFIQNGGFDESFRFPSVEDQEFSFRLARKGYLMVFEPSAVVFHYHDRTLSEYLQRKFGIGYWKAFMLHWTPEKIFSDSHTAPTQRAEILLLAMMLATIPFIVFWPYYATIFLLIILAVFIAITSSFLIFIRKRDPHVLWVAPAMLLGRAGALGLGLIKGFVLPPKAESKGLPCLSMHVRLIKRIIDIAGGCIGLFLSGPVVACAAVAIRLDSRGPIFFRQVRAGENGKPFTIVKLRTMVDGADQMVMEVLHKSQLKGPAFKIPNDPRITRVGRYLRRWSLDELPQFWNVLKGEMSLVGPRPEELEIVKLYNDYQRQRLMVKPGLTGPMQVNGRGDLNLEERLKLELNYLRNYTLLEDLRIIFKTFSAVFSGKGAS
jgi:lipopolysaccharide/colanic/teichoic acid biosynthesis glycosyltransferase/glycosyltransferase involved in cell wall biosynthesis